MPYRAFTNEMKQPAAPQDSQKCQLSSQQNKKTDTTQGDTEHINIYLKM